MMSFFARIFCLAGVLFVLAGCYQQVTTTPTPIRAIRQASAIPSETVSMLLSQEERFPAWDFSLAERSGEIVTLSEQRGKWVLINFWATYCVPCRTEMPILQRLSEEYPQQLRVIGINQRETSEQVEAFMTEFSLDFTVLLNPDDTLLMDYTMISLPQTLLIDPEGQVAWRMFGSINEPYLEMLLKQAFSE